MTSNLTPGQYQIGDNPGVVFGAGTPYDVTTCDAQPYNTQAQDSQTNRSDTVNFGVDSLQAQPIQLEMLVQDFQILKNMVPYTGVNLPESFNNKGLDRAEAFAFEWNAQAARRNYGQVIPFKCCGRDGTTRVAYGRPRKIHVGKRYRRAPMIPVQAEFLPEEPMYHDDEETALVITNQAVPTKVLRTKGKGDAWLSILLTGPMTHPVITVGSNNIELDHDLAEGDVVEISSYPWRRRIVDNHGINLSSKLVGDTQYLDQLVIPPNIEIPVRWTSEELRTWVPVMQAQSWVEQIDSNFFRVPDTFTTIHGRAAVRLDIFNPSWFKPYLSADIFADRTALIYNAKTFGTADQYMEATIVEPFTGKSGMAIMSDTAMTNFAILVVTSGILGSKLQIFSGTNYNALTARSAVWTNPNFFGWTEVDKIGIGFDSASKMYQAYVNGVSLGTACQWNDSASIVTTGASKRSSGFIFDIDGNLFTTGTGFADILAYDTAEELTDVGQVILTYRNAYHTFS